MDRRWTGDGRSEYCPQCRQATARPPGVANDEVPGGQRIVFLFCGRDARGLCARWRGTSGRRAGMGHTAATVRAATCSMAVGQIFATDTGVAIGQALLARQVIVRVMVVGVRVIGVMVAPIAIVRIVIVCRQLWRVGRPLGIGRRHNMVRLGPGQFLGRSKATAFAPALLGIGAAAGVMLAGEGLAGKLAHAGGAGCPITAAR